MKLFRETFQKFFNQSGSQGTLQIHKKTHTPTHFGAKELWVLKRFGSVNGSIFKNKGVIYISGGSGIRKTRYKNCSMRIYRKVFRKDSKKEILEGEENADVKDTIDVNTKNIEPVRTSPIRTRIMKPIEPKTDELIYLIDDIDIGNSFFSIFVSRK